MSRRQSVSKDLGRRVREARTDSSNVRSLANPNRSAEESDLRNTTHVSLIRFERDGSPVTRLPIIFPDHRFGDQRIDLSFLLSLRNLYEPLSVAFRSWGTNVARKTRQEAARQLSRGFVRFAKSKKPDMSLRDLDETMLSAFIKWLDSADGSARNNITHPNTRRKNIHTLHVMLLAMTKHNLWKEEALRVLDIFPSRVYVATNEKSNPRARLSREHLEAIDAAAQRELIAIRNRLAEGRRLIEEGRAKIANGSSDYSDIAVTLAELTRRYPNVIPNYKQLRKEAPDLYSWVYKSNHRNHGFGNTLLGSYLYASPRELVPIVLLFAIEGGFNAESVLQMEFEELEIVSRLGVGSLRVSPKKHRGKKDPVKFFDPVWVLPWLQALEELTVRLRPFLPQQYEQRLFVYAQKWGEKRAPTAFEASKSSAGDSRSSQFPHALKSFISDNDLKRFTLGQLRPTESDEVGLAHGSLVASQAMNHAQFQTTEASYLSAGTRARESERLSLIVDQMKRWVVSGGKIDTRRSGRPNNFDKGSATPGFTCADPYDSPRPGQSQHRLCKAYGECPSCSQAAVNPSDPVSVAFYLGLKDAIVRGQAAMTPVAWLTKWRPILADLSGIFALVSESTLHKASQYTLRLPTVG
jgi:hypothetical protein